MNPALTIRMQFRLDDVTRLSQLWRRTVEVVNTNVSPILAVAIPLSIPASSGDCFENALNEVNALFFGAVWRWRTAGDLEHSIGARWLLACPV